MTVTPTFTNALRALSPDSNWTSWDDDYSKLEWDSDNKLEKPTESEITAKQAELKTAWDAAQYQRDRVDKYNQNKTDTYPNIGDQLDMIYHDQVNGTTTFKDAIKAVKDKHPKP